MIALDDLGPVMPIIVIDDAAAALPLLQALSDAGIAAAEITLRTPAALVAIEQASRQSGVIVGAGTVLSTADVDSAAQRGAQFVVSPGLDDAVVQRAQEHNIRALPGVATASELMRAKQLGLDAVKVFPITELGGPLLLKAFQGPFPMMRFMPSGGITAQALRNYSGLPCVFSVGVSWLASRQEIRNRNFSEVRKRAEAVLHERAASHG